MSYQITLPYSEEALSPIISRQTIQFHYGKHHSGYAAKLIDALEGKDGTPEDLTEIVKNIDSYNLAVRKNAGQCYNHNLYWQSLSPEETSPSQVLLEQIKKDFESLDNLENELIKAANAQFGSGWAWLSYNPIEKKLEVTKTQNEDGPLMHGKLPLLTIDVWEHAYYLDYQNRRPDYTNEVITKLLNWENASKLFLEAAE